MDASFVITKSTSSKSINLHIARVAVPSKAEVLVKFHFSPINPLDLAVIAGAYPVKPQFSHESESVLGFDAIGEVVLAGPEAQSLKVGDFVVPSQYGIGTWRSHALIQETLLDKIPEPNDLRFGAILRLGILPAYFLVERMCNLRPGDWILQNAGTSVVAQMVAQFACRRGIKVVSVVRDRDDGGSVLEALTTPGASRQATMTGHMVITESQLQQEKQGMKFVLAIDSVGGFSGQQLLDCLSAGGTFVQHGFLSGTDQILPLNTLSFWARNLSMVCSRSSAQMAGLSADERRNLMTWIVELANHGELSLPKLGLEEVSLDPADAEENKNKLDKAINKAKRGRLGQRKQIIAWG